MLRLPVYTQIFPVGPRRATPRKIWGLGPPVRIRPPQMLRLPVYTQIFPVGPRRATPRKIWGLDAPRAHSLPANASAPRLHANFSGRAPSGHSAENLGA